MLNDIYIYENRDLVYLKLYKEKARRFNIQVTVLGPDNLINNEKYNRFLSLYEHHSVNSLEFEVNCFARYFAIEAAHQNDQSFILSDSDIYLVNNLQHLREDESLKGVFVGSEGYYGGGSEHQISPHFSFWNKSLISSFTDYLLEVYEKNKKDPFLGKHYELQQQRLGRTAISDMTLLYMWVKDRGISYLNSNFIGSTLGIDHNLSSLYTKDGMYKSFYNRKALKLKGDEVFCEATDGRIQRMAVLHFQGDYKSVLKYLYQGRMIRFNWVPIYRSFKKKFRR